MSRKIINYKTEFGRFKQMHRYYKEIMPIISEGDSWFSYPLTGSNMMDHLVWKFAGGINYLRLESSGDQALKIFKSTTSGQLKKLIKHVRDFNVPIVLLSAGGNDAVGKSKKGLYQKALNSTDVDTLINSPKLNEIFADILKKYTDALIALIAVNPEIRVITHTYDYPAVIGKPAPITIKSLGIIAPVVNVLKEVGPWIEPILKDKKLTDKQAQLKFAERIIDKFHDEILIKLKSEFSANFDYVDLRGTLELKRQNWNDEIHPSAAGFELLANKFWQQLRPEIIDAYNRWQS